MTRRPVETTISSILKESNAEKDGKETIFRNYSKTRTSTCRFQSLCKIPMESILVLRLNEYAEMERMKLKVVPETQVRLVLSIKDPHET